MQSGKDLNDLINKLRATDAVLDPTMDRAKAEKRLSRAYASKMLGLQPGYFSLLRRSSSVPGSFVISCTAAKVGENGKTGPVGIVHHILMPRKTTAGFYFNKSPVKLNGKSAKSLADAMKAVLKELGLHTAMAKGGSTYPTDDVLRILKQDPRYGASGASAVSGSTAGTGGSIAGGSTAGESESSTASGTQTGSDESTEKKGGKRGSSAVRAHRSGK
jgi:hypothetical protein